VEVIMKKLIMLICSLILGFIINQCGKNNPIGMNDVPEIKEAKILISSKNVINSKVVHGMGNSTLYIAKPYRVEPGMNVIMVVKTPLMHDHKRYFMMYDDGTHGDPHPGDGEYCYEDISHMPGIHMMDAAHGHYEFEFYCINSQQNHGAHYNAWVEISK